MNGLQVDSKMPDDSEIPGVPPGRAKLGMPTAGRGTCQHLHDNTNLNTDPILWVLVNDTMTSINLSFGKKLHHTNAKMLKKGGENWGGQR